MKETIGKRRMRYLALFCYHNPYALKHNDSKPFPYIRIYSILPNRTDMFRRKKFVYWQIGKRISIPNLPSTTLAEIAPCINSTNSFAMDNPNPVEACVRDASPL